jgi:hypothetical protein
VVKVDIKLDAANMVEGLSAMGAGMKGAVSRLLRALATSTKKYIKKRMGAYVHERTGMLKKAVYGFRRGPTYAVVASGEGHIAEPLERGAVVRPKKGKYLSFRGDDGDWHRVKELRIPAKHWFTKSAEGFEDSPDYVATIDKVIGKEIKKALG